MFYEPLGLDQGHRFLEIGLGSGYGTALAREVVGPEGLVVSVEIDPLTFAFGKENLERAGYRDIVLIQGDGGLGCPEMSPYDRIAVTAACRKIPPPLIDQLRTGGRLIVPMIEDDVQNLVLAEKTETGTVRQIICEVRYVPLKGICGGSERAQRLDSDALMPTMGTNELLVSYPWRQFHPARHEITRILRQFGDPHPQIEKTNVPGIAIVRTTLNNRDVIRRCRELFEGGPIFRFAVKWVPVDFWCETELQAMKSVIETHIRDLIDQDDTWAMEVEKRRWRQYHTKEIIDYLAASIDRKVDLRNPDRILRIDVLGPKTAISLLTPDEIFSRCKAHPPRYAIGRGAKLMEVKERL